MSTLIAPQLKILAPKSPQTLLHLPPKPIKFLPKSSTRTNQSSSSSDDNGIPSDQVKTLAKFKSLHNQIQVLQVSRRAKHPLAGSRLLLLDAPGNIHSISFLLQPLTSAYFDVFAALPPVLPPGPVAVLGFGAGSAARLLLTLYPDLALHGWELDPAVVAVAREFFGLSKLEKQHPHRLFIHVQDAFEAEIAGGFAGILVDVFSKGSVVPQLQERGAWETLKGRLRRGGRVMVNCGGKCVEAEEEGRDGEAVLESTLEAMGRVWGAHQVFVLRLGRRKEDGNSSCVAFTGEMPDREAWKHVLPRELRGYVDMWAPYRQRPPPLGQADFLASRTIFFANTVAEASECVLFSISRRYENLHSVGFEIVAGFHCSLLVSMAGILMLWFTRDTMLQPSMTYLLLTWGRIRRS